MPTGVMAVLVLVAAALVGCVLGAALTRLLDALIGRFLRRDLMYDDVSTKAEVAKGYIPVAPPTAPTEDWDESRLVACRACARMRELHERFPKLTIDQLDAIVRRQVALGHCPAHAYADRVD